MKLSPKGFLLLEVLMALLILVVAFAAFMGAISQALRVSVKASHLTDAISQFESLFFEIESGARLDLASYGGHGDLKGGCRYRIEAEGKGNLGALLKSHLSWKEGRESLDLEFTVLRAPIQ